MGAETGAILENDDANPCIGCGPRNARGLRLSFRRVGDHVESEFLADASLEGWPDRLHSGILYIAMLETANWTVYGILGRIGVPVSTSALDARRWVSTGTRIRLAGRAVPRGPGGVNVPVEAVTPEGQLVATLERDYVLPNRKEFLERLGYAEFPEAFRGLVPD